MKKDICLIYAGLHFPVSNFPSLSVAGIDDIPSTKQRVPFLIISTFFYTSRWTLHIPDHPRSQPKDPINLSSQKEFSHKIAQMITSTKSNGIVSFHFTYADNYLCWSWNWDSLGMGTVHGLVGNRSVNLCKCEFNPSVAQTE